MENPLAERTELSATRRIPCGPREVWNACTSKRGLETWWSASDLRTRVRRLEVRPGGGVELHVRYLPSLITAGSSESFRAAGVPISFDLRGKIGELVAERVIEYDLSLDLGKNTPGVRMVTRFELSDDGDATVVKLSALGQSDPQWKTLSQRTLDAQLERLELAASEPRTTFVD
jgi:uncharacterized protein YndB with AHSA1/START domain